ncbi:hypothetical protein [Bacillus sp. mrc49]|uniref:hypothetical protein n=2 Tax=Bacillus sp. mrc49 TaxID=2054913 RepID=UPI000C27D50F|nr:hypothetical protein [Bacillus sp. mrc49]PJN91170.1 hypothetical protein CVN76_06390 [Bacillus sp. mrc49]
MKFKIIGIIILTCIILSPFNTLAQESLSERNTIIKELEKKIAIVDKLLLVEVGKAETKQKFVDQVNQIHIDVENYLLTLENDIFYDLNQYYELSDKLGELDIKSEPYFNSGMRSLATSWRYGDILYYSSGSKNSIGEKSYTGHTAVLSTTDYYVIEASKTKNNGAKVHHWNRSNLWGGG